MSATVFDRLLDQIDFFIRKYYKNQIIRGLIWFVGIFLSMFLIVNVLEYYGRFGTGVRAILFFTFFAVNLFVFIRFIVIPLSKLYSFGTRINRYQAAEIIGSFFPHISDRLLNTLQLNDDLNNHVGNIELLRASISQRSESLSVIPFADAINVKENLKYIKWVAPLVLLLLLLGILSPKFFTESSKRIVNYSTVFIPEAPFDFIVEDYERHISEGSDLTVRLKLKGDDLPTKVFLVSKQGKQLLNLVGRNTFEGTISKVNTSGTFFFLANEYASKEYNYHVYGKPVLGLFKAEIIYPKYLGKSNELFSSAGDMMIPEGSTIVWNVVSKNTELTRFTIGDSTLLFAKDGFRVERMFKNSEAISIELRGKDKHAFDSLKFNVNVIKDAYPSITVEEKVDSIRSGIRYFTGVASDDYGLTNLKFVYTITSVNGSKRSETIKVKNVSGLDTKFDFAVDFMRESIKLDDKIEYYFVVSDNDGVNGSKSSKSKVFVYEIPSYQELSKIHEEVQENSKNELSDYIKKSNEFLKDLERLQRNLLNNKSNDWKQKNQLNQLKNQYEDLLNSIEQSKNSLNNTLEEKQRLTPEDQALIEKQQMLDDLLKQLMDSEIMKLLDDLEKLMELNNKEEQQKLIDELKMSSEDMTKQLDRSLEMLKKLQVDEKFDAIEEALKKLSKEQLDLQKSIENKKISKEESIKKQQEIDDKFEQVKDDLKQLEKLNQDLARPMDIPNTESQQNSIDSDLQQAEDNLSKNKESKAGQNQKSAADQMEKLAEQLDKAQNDSNQQQQGEDIEMLREILESLLILSFDQEDVMNRFLKISGDDPKFRYYSRVQKTIVDNTQPVADSLFLLAKRQPQLSKFVDDELKSINKSHQLVLDNLHERKMRDVASNQQLAMTSFNNLALMLNESLQQMQQQMQQMMEGSGSCSKPGGKGKSKPSDSDNLGNMKEMLKKQLEQMQQGKSPGGKGNGDSPANGGEKDGLGLSNKEIAKMAAEQNAIRQRLEQLKNELNKGGKGEGNQLNPLLQELEKQQQDLINKNHSNLVKRQQDILTRLLESEKALRERGFDEKRESNEAINQNFGNLIRFDEYNKDKLKQIELLRTIDPIYSKYYKDKAIQFFNLIND